MKKPFRILSSDLLIADVITDMDGNARLVELVDELGLKAGGKITVSKEELGKLAVAVEGYPASEFPGGSSANLLVTLSHMMGSGVQVDFIGRTGDGHFGAMIAEAMQAAHVHMIEPAMPQNAAPDPAITYVIKYADGERTTATYPGNAHQAITVAALSETMVSNTDAIFMQGSLWEKFDPAFCARMLTLRDKHCKKLWLALPTRAGFGVKRQDMWDIIPGCNLVLANIAELSRIGGIIDAEIKESDITTDQKGQALARLQQSLTQDGQAGFITDGKYGAWVVTPHEILHVGTVNKTEITNTVGAGDTAYAGFLYGYLTGRSLVGSAKIGMAMAGEKLKCNGPRLPDAKATLDKILSGGL